MAKNKRISMIALFSAIAIILLSTGVLAADYRLLCLKKGETIKFSECNPTMNNYYCNSNIYCSYCVFIGENGAYCPGNLNKCNALGLSCSSLDDKNGTTIDKQPPVISVCFPEDGKIYGSKSQLVRCTADKQVDWYYQDLTGSSSSWKKLCDGVTTCDKTVSFDEGPNHIKIKAIDKYGNSAEVEKTFNVDSKKPRIYRTYPKRGFSNGEFEVEFKEDNPKSLVLYYGDKSQGVDLNSCTTESNKKHCPVTVDVSSFDQQTISYFFELKDVADNTVVSKTINLDVDISPPILLNSDSFWTQGTGTQNKYITFNMIINEKNLESIKYSDSLGSSSSLKRICSSLREGKCTKKISFSKKGHHIINIEMLDEAGNLASTSFEFDVV